MTRNRCRGLVTTVTLGAVTMMLWAPSVADGQIVRLRAYRGTDLGVIGDAGALNNEAGANLTATFEVRRFIQGVQRNIPKIQTVDDPCRDSMDIDTGPGRALAINDSRIVVGRRGAVAFEWFPSQCPNTVQSGALPQLAGALSSQANANNNTRDAVGSTSLIVLSAIQDFPTVWRKVTGGFTALQLQTPFRPAPLDAARQPGAALDINESGTIVGFTRVGEQLYNRAAIFFENQDPEILQKTPAAADYLFRLNEARGISSSGYITGIASRYFPSSAGGRQTRGFIRTPDGTITGTLIPDDDQYIGSEARKINDYGFAVGKVLKNDGGSAAAVWRGDGRLALLNGANVDLLPAGTVLTEAIDINEQGYILAKGLVNGELHLFILRPFVGVLILHPEDQSY